MQHVSVHPGSSMASRIPSKPPPKPAAKPPVRPKPSADQSSFQTADPRKGDLARKLNTDIGAGVGMDTLGGHEAEGLFSPGALLRHTGSHAVPAEELAEPEKKPAAPKAPPRPAPKPRKP